MMSVGPIQFATGFVVMGLLAAGAYFLLKKKSGFLTQEKQRVKLISKEVLSHDVCIFRFETSPGLLLGLKAGRHLIVSATKEGKMISRNYSPVSPENTVGYFDLCVKVYRPNEKFPQGGLMSQYLDAMTIGEFVEVKGPIGKCYYSGPAELTMLQGEAARTKRVTSLGMIAGGVGLTPLLAILRKILANPADTTKVTLLFANQTENDIFMREELEALQERHSNFKLWYTLDRPSPDWKFSQGFITADMIKQNMFDGGNAPSSFLICGPPPMVKFACLPNLEQLGVPQDDVIVF